MKYYIEPFRLVGMEGLYGILISLSAILIASSIKCPFSIFTNSCVCTENNIYMEGGIIYLK
jgi:hypothetical protein